jgi:hypothetical protein
VQRCRGAEAKKNRGAEAHTAEQQNGGEKTASSPARKIREDGRERGREREREGEREGKRERGRERERKIERAVLRTSSSFRTAKQYVCMYEMSDCMSRCHHPQFVSQSNIPFQISPSTAVTDSAAYFSRSIASIMINHFVRANVHTQHYQFQAAILIMSISAFCFIATALPSARATV